MGRGLQLGRILFSISQKGTGAVPFTIAETGEKHSTHDDEK
jgi:hypothetical protein